MLERLGGLTRFVILAAPRTGSNWLCSLLNSHPDILCHHEIFNPNGIFYALEHRNGTLNLGTIEERNRQPLTFLNRIWQHPLGSRCVGFKMTRGQDEHVLQAMLDDDGIRKILLRRRNAVRTYVSEMIAKQTGRWEAYDPTEMAGQPPRVRIVMADLLDHLRLNETFYERLQQSLGGSHQYVMELWYEQLFNVDSHSRVLRFLGVPNPTYALSAKSVRQNPRPLKQLVSNYRELESALTGSEFEQLLQGEEGANGREVSRNARSSRCPTAPAL